MEEQSQPETKTLKELGATSDRLPNRKARRAIAKKRGVFKTQGQWLWLTKNRKD